MNVVWPGQPLSGREKECVALYAQGWTHSEVGERLFITEQTVKSHLRSARTKTGARNSTHLVALLVTDGLVAL
jgi:DNA-binding CsgD family transcriptional regulator